MGPFRDWTYDCSNVCCIFLKVGKQVPRRRGKLKLANLFPIGVGQRGLYPPGANAYRFISAWNDLSYKFAEFLSLRQEVTDNLKTFEIIPCKEIKLINIFIYQLICCKENEKHISSGLTFIWLFFLCWSLIVLCLIIQVYYFHGQVFLKW